MLSTQVRHTPVTRDLFEEADAACEEAAASSAAEEAALAGFLAAGGVFLAALAALAFSRDAFWAGVCCFTMFDEMVGVL